MTAVLHSANIGRLICKYGEIENFPPTLMHEPDNSRPCVHLTGPMPRIMLVRRAPVERLNFQPRIGSAMGHHPIIARRRGSLLTLSVDLIGPRDMPHPQRGTRCRDHRVLNQWHFRLTEVDHEPHWFLAVRQLSAEGGEFPKSE